MLSEHPNLATRWGFPIPDWGLLLVIAWPLLLLINPAWVFTRPINQATFLADAWIYWGYFRSYRLYSGILPDHYFQERLAWVLPGTAAYRLFPPLIANYVLHLGVYLLATVSLYVAIKYALGRKTALIVTLIIGSYTQFLQSVGWDYPDGIGIAYLSLLIAMLVLAQRRAVWLIGAGVALVLVINAQLSWAPPAAVICAGCLIADTARNKRPILPTVGYLLVGILLAGGILTAIFYTLNGRWWILENSIRWAGSHVNSLEMRQQQLYEWYPPPYSFLAIPAVVFAASGIKLGMAAARREIRLDQPAVLWPALYVLYSLYMVASHYLTAYPVLIMVMYFAQALPLMVMALAALLCPTLEALNAAEFQRVLAVTLGALLLPFAALALIGYAGLNGGVPLLWLMALGALSAAIIAMHRLPIMARLIAAIMVFSATNTLTSPSMFDPASSRNARDTLIATNEVFTLMRDRYPQADALVWMADDEHLNVYKAISAANLWGWERTRCCIPEYRDVITEQTPSTFAPPHLVLLGADLDTFEIGQAAIEARYGCTLRLVEQRDITHGTIRFRAWFAAVDLPCQGAPNFDQAPHYFAES